MELSEDSNNKAMLVQQMDKGRLANLMSGYLTEWLGQFNEVTIANLKRCPEQEMGRYRSLLLASEAFEAKLRADIMNGHNAEEEILQLQQESMEDIYEKGSW